MIVVSRQTANSFEQTKRTLSTNSLNSLVKQEEKSAAKRAKIETESDQHKNSIDVDTLMKSLCNEDVDALKSWLEKSNMFGLSKEKTTDQKELYQYIANEVCSPTNVDQYPDLECCFNLAKDAFAYLGGDINPLLEYHYCDISE